jgi:hypothetical protein
VFVMLCDDSSLLLCLVCVQQHLIAGGVLLTVWIVAVQTFNVWLCSMLALLLTSCSNLWFRCILMPVVWTSHVYLSGGLALL